MDGRLLKASAGGVHDLSWLRLPLPPVQSHTDLRLPPRTQLLSTVHGRAAGMRALEAGIVGALRYAAALCVLS